VVSRRIAAAAVAFSFAGQGAGLLAGRKLVASAGALALTGQAVAFSQARLAEAGSFALTGQAASFVRKSNLRTILNELGLSTNLRLVLDAGDITSAPASPTKWLDLSGNGYDFFRGTTSGAEASDPTFNGTPGNLSDGEYWSFDGGDFFRYDTTNETWMQNLHKDNAVRSFAAWFYLNAPSVTQRICGTSNIAGGNVGFAVFVSNVGALQWSVNNTVAGGAIGINSSGISATVAGWNFLGISFSEGAGTWNFQVNGEAIQKSGSYSSPSAANATYTMEIGTAGNGASIIPSGARAAMLGMWEGTVLTPTQLDAIYEATRGRFGV
jgi:hypothetical protein